MPDLSAYPDDFAALLEEYNKEISALMKQLADRAITATQWQKSMAALLTGHSYAARLLGSGLDELTQQDVKALKVFLKDQFKYLDGFTTVIQAAEEYNTAWESRADLYGEAATTQYWEGKVGDLPLPAMPAQGTNCKNACRCAWDIQWIDKEAGDADCFWRLEPGAKHCQTCEVRAEMWNPIKVRNGMLQ